MSLLLLSLLACASSPDGGSELRPQRHEVQSFRTRTPDTPDAAPLEPDLAFALRERCPSIQRARYQPDTQGWGTLTVWGEGLGDTRLLAVMPDGSMARAPAHVDGEGWSFAVRCQDCQLMFMQTLVGQPAACQGPGHSLRLAQGHLQDPS